MRRRLLDCAVVAATASVLIGFGALVDRPKMAGAGIVLLVIGVLIALFRSAEER